MNLVPRALRKAGKKARFAREFSEFKKLSAQDARFKPHWRERYPMLNDRTGTTGFDAHYVFHPAWAARILAELKPTEHVDISSSLYFCSMISAFIPTRFYDYRPTNLGLSGLQEGSADLMNLPFADASVASLSCMHVVEHVGLGRYGDPLDPVGDLKAIAELTRVLEPGGTLLFAAPIGRPRVRFNAHRVYSHAQVLEAFRGLELREFSLIPDDAETRGMIRHATPAQADAQAYGCGCFWFVR